MTHIRPPLMTCIYNERGYQLYLIDGIPTVFHNWTTRKKQKDGTWLTTPHEEVFAMSEWTPGIDTRPWGILKNMNAAHSDLFALK